jgi:hypothetical protein
MVLEDLSALYDPSIDDGHAAHQMHGKRDNVTIIVA